MKFTVPWWDVLALAAPLALIGYLNLVAFAPLGLAIFNVLVATWLVLMGLMIGMTAVRRRSS